MPNLGEKPCLILRKMVRVAVSIRGTFKPSFGGSEAE